MKNSEVGGMKIKATTVLVAAIVIILHLAGQTTRAQMIGEAGVLRGVPGAGSVPVFVDRKALDAYYEANARNDYEDGMKELFNAGKLYMVDVGTKVRVLDGGFTGWKEIRILEGEFTGRRGFVSGQCVSEK